ncbi:hypothetical protein [Paraburkholderia dinghuensis]|uniref:hypothetical protein n=1 Tax=Paraburkholderia dinghuensis TaxID=2305225 RepID=UPI0016236F3A|nr:hypothetical protein [Paraburkholderia dinghuensis]
MVLFVSLDVEEALLVELAAVVAAFVELADETVLPSFVTGEATPFCCATDWNSAPRNC